MSPTATEEPDDSLRAQTESLAQTTAWACADKLRGQLDSGDYLKAVLEALVSTQPLDPAEWPSEMALARRWIRANPSESLPFLKAVIALLSSRARWGAVHTTSPAIDQVMTTATRALVEDRLADNPVVLDVACGSGMLLASVAHEVARVSDQPTVALGSDVNPTVVGVARRFMRLVGQEGEIDQVDVLAEDGSLHRSVDLAVSDLPLNLSGRSDKRTHDPRFRFGLPSSDNVTFLFIQSMLARLRAPEDGGGLALALVSNAPLFASDKGSRSIRRMMTEEDLLRAVISLPERLMDSTGIPVNVLVFDNAKPSGWRGKVQFIDLRGQFTDSKEIRRRRKISDAGLVELERSLRRPKPSRLARTLRNVELEFKVAEVTFTPPGAQDGKQAFRVAVPASQDVAEWSARRYERSVLLSGQDTGIAYVSWNPAELIPRSSAHTERSEPQDKWQYAPLLALIRQVILLAPSESSREDRGGVSDPEGWLTLPLSASNASRVLGPGDEAPPQQVLLLEVAEGIDPQFLSHWMNSDAGRSVRGAALLNHRVFNAVRSSPDALAFLDRLDAPVPPLRDQGEVTATLNALQAARSDLDQMERATWSDPESSVEVREALTTFVDQSERLHAWIESLPFPIASSLWTYVSLGNRPKDAYEQLLKSFEAIAEFHASHMIAALRSDPSLWDEHTPRLAAKMSQHSLSFRRASFGTWKSTSELLAGVLRAGIGTDDEETQRYLGLLGDPQQFGALRLLSPDFARVMNTVIQLRNDWQGHGGTTTRDEAIRRRDHLHQQLLELRSSLGSGWGGLRLVRIGQSTWDGARHRYEVEVLQGSKTPFAPDEVLSDIPLVYGSLYLTSGSGGSVQLPGFVRMGESPGSIENTCYFYNKVADGDSVRVVTYQYADKPDGYREDAGLAMLVAELDGAH